MNKSGYKPVGHKVLVKPFDVEEVSPGGIVLFTADEQKKEEMAQTQGQIVAIGPTAWADQPDPWASIGDKVLFGKYAGQYIDGEDGVRYRLLDDLNIAAIKS
jgi:chaperonin GroES